MSLVVLMMDFLIFQTGKEAFHWRIIVPAPNTVHAGLNAMILQDLLVFPVCVLAALIGMMDQPQAWLTTLEGHPQRFDGQLTGHAIRHGPAHNPPRIKVHDYRQVQPTFFCRNICDISQPDPIWPFNVEIPF